MKFSRSLFGYAPAEVKRINDEVLTKYESEKRALFLLLENASREYDKLVEQRNLLTANLQSTRDSSSLHNKDVFDITLNHVERSAFSKMEEITENQEDFIEAINNTIEEIDSVIANLKQEFIEMTNSLTRTIESIITKSQFGEQISTSLDSTIDNLYSHYEAAPEPFKALDFYILEYQTNQKNQPAPLPPSKVPEKNEVISTSTEAKHSKTVLVAENDSEISSLLSYVLEREGFDIILATDGYILINMIKENEPPGIIILDTLLPYIQTKMLIKEIRKSETWCNVPILVTTSEHNKQVTIEALECGANDSLVKPFNPRELVARVKRLNKSLEKMSCEVGG